MTKRKPKTAHLTWRGTLLSIKHTPQYFGHADHVEVTVKKPVKAILPITDTGYRSHFIDPDELQAAGGAVLFVQAWLEREATTQACRDRQAKLAQLDFLELLIQPPLKRRRRRSTVG
jgi:hypothetical protein